MVTSFTSNGLSWFLSSVDEITAAIATLVKACGPLQSVHVCTCTLHKTVLETNSETITTKRHAVNAFIRTTCTMDNITVVDLAAEAVLQGEKAAFILLLVISACFSIFK